jgi:hypothetical protein
MIGQAFGEESRSCTRVLECHSLFRIARKSEIDEEQSKEHVHHFLSHKEECSQRTHPSRLSS